MNILKVESANMGGNCIVNLVFFEDGSVLSTNEEGATMHTAEEWNSGMAWFFGIGERPEDEAQWERENIEQWENNSKFWEYPNVWNHGNGFFAKRVLSISPATKEAMVDHALNNAVSIIQKRLGQHDGFNAGMFFSDKWSALISMFSEYVDYELDMMRRDNNE